ncbi:MAG: hypothetical protein PHQ53_13095, partial [Candidatus Krumholzibacteria bacterium]|nr:hypothetical protein [Candidatus Krumholzibacteria bacterium]
SQISTLRDRMGVCKVDCERSFIDAEQFLRETGYQRRQLEDMQKTLASLDGKMTVAEKLPEICADITRSVVTEMNRQPRRDPQ